MTSTTFFFVFIPILAVILLAVNLIFAPHNPYNEKNSTFECGFHSFLGQNRTQFSISFFIFALLFLLFDLEILLAYPYVVSAYTNAIYGLVIFLIFMLALTLGFVFELGKNALKIDSRQMFILAGAGNNSLIYYNASFFSFLHSHKIRSVCLLILQSIYKGGHLFFSNLSCSSLINKLLSSIKLFIYFFAFRFLLFFIGIDNESALLLMGFAYPLYFTYRLRNVKWTIEDVLTAITRILLTITMLFAVWYTFFITLNFVNSNYFDFCSFIYFKLACRLDDSDDDEASVPYNATVGQPSNLNNATRDATTGATTDVSHTVTVATTAITDATNTTRTEGRTDAIDATTNATNATTDLPTDVTSNAADVTSNASDVTSNAPINGTDVPNNIPNNVINGEPTVPNGESNNATNGESNNATNGELNNGTDVPNGEPDNATNGEPDNATNSESDNATNSESDDETNSESDNETNGEWDDNETDVPNGEPSFPNGEPSLPNGVTNGVTNGEPSAPSGVTNGEPSAPNGVPNGVTNGEPSAPSGVAGRYDHYRVEDLSHRGHSAELQAELDRLPPRYGPDGEEDLDAADARDDAILADIEERDRIYHSQTGRHVYGLEGHTRYNPRTESFEQVTEQEANRSELPALLRRVDGIMAGWDELQRFERYVSDSEGRSDESESESESESLPVPDSEDDRSERSSENPDN